MTPEEAIEKIRKADHVIVIHKSQVFFNTTNYDEALKWEGQGARIIPHYTLDEIAHRKKKGRHTVPGWEVHVLGCIDEITDEDEVITNEVLLLAARHATMNLARGNS